MEIIGLVTARSGSKRIPEKNKKIFCGKPLIVWTFECVQYSKEVTNWILSTDDQEIIDLSNKYPIRAPFIRPNELANDDSTSYDVVLHCLDWLINNDNCSPDWLILLEPTSPARQPFHIDEVVNIIKNKSNKIDSICGVSKLKGNASAFKALRLDKNNILRPWIGKKYFSQIAIRNQLVKPSYYINSLIYAFNVKKLLSNESDNLWGKKVYSYETHSQYICDIDYKEDWIVAESKMNYLINNFARKLNG